MSDEPVVETPTVADMPPDFGNPGMADFADPAWDEGADEVGEVPDSYEPEDSADDDPEEGDEAVPDEPDEDEEPVVPPGIEEEQLEDSDEDYDPEE